MAKVQRLFETTRHLSAEQWVFRVLTRGQRVVRQKLPQRTYQKIAKAAEALPLPDLSARGLLQAAEPVFLLQNEVHSRTLTGIGNGTFTFLNRTVGFENIDKVDWRLDLGEANNPLWRMNLSYFGWSVPLLAEGGVAELDIVEKMVKSLEAQNGFEIPGVFRDVWNAYSASHRCINLLVGAALYRAKNGEHDPRLDTLVKHARFCAAFVRHSLERELQYNHLFKNFVALSVFSSGCNGFPDDFAFVQTAALRSLLSQTLADGGQAERCPMYHILGLLDVRVLLATGIYDAISTAKLAEVERQMTSALEVMTLPDGDIALFNDSWRGEGPKAHLVLDRTDGIDPKATLIDTGYTRLTDGTDCIIFDHGACGPDDNPGHAHADFLSVETTIKGSRFFVDPGVPTYSMGQLRNQSRSAAWHNGPHLVGAEPIDFWASFRVGHRGYAYDLPLEELEDLVPLAAAGWQNGYLPHSVLVARYVALWPGQAFLAVDVWDGPPTLSARTRWMVDGSWRQNEQLVFSKDDAYVKVSVPRGKVGSIEPADTWPRFGMAHPAHAINVHAEPTQFGAVAATLAVTDRTFQLPGSLINSVAENLRRQLLARKR